MATNASGGQGLQDELVEICRFEGPALPPLALPLEQHVKVGEGLACFEAPFGMKLHHGEHEGPQSQPVKAAREQLPHHALEDMPRIQFQ